MRDDDLRNRWKSVINDRASKATDKDILDIWQEQQRMRSEDERIEKELAHAKQKAKELKRTLRKHQLGIARDRFSALKESIGSRTTVLQTGNFTHLLNKKHSRAYLIAGIVLIIAVIGLVKILPPKDQSATLGESTTGAITVQNDLPREKPAFALLYPSGTDESKYDVVRISPDGSAPSYTYLDRLENDGAIFRVTQQEVPAGFDLVKTARDFQATNVIQIDDMKVYHGYSEKGGIQSLIFEKDKKLISIRSPQKFSDDAWASYILSLN